MRRIKIRKNWTTKVILPGMAAGLVLFMGPPLEAHAQDTKPAISTDLADLSLEDLMEVKVTSVSKQAEAAGAVSAALFVLTNQDIRRSGARTIPEVLRMVPGLQVAQIDGNRWAVSARGTNSLFANKLLVLMDGRSVYTPLFSGVYWDAQDTRLEDIERIEVIRGPGASVWGANAVNGVINIITKSAQRTLGGEVSGTIGTEERGAGNVRYGEKISETSAARIYGKYFNRDRSAQIAGDDAYDQWEAGQGGARFDYQEGLDSLTFQGDLYKGNNGFQASAPSYTSFAPTTQRKTTHYDGNNLLARWQSGFSDGQRLDVQVYLDKTGRSDLLLSGRCETRDLDLQHLIPVTSLNDLMVGFNYRHTRDYQRPTEQVQFSQTDRSTELYGGFVQNETRLLSNMVRFTFGSKFENNSHTGFELQPTARLAWVPSSTQTVWGAFSRAVRTPSRVENDGKILFSTVPGINGIPTSVFAAGNPRMQSETVNSYELGYRAAPLSNYSFDVATFFSDYSSLSNLSMQTPVFNGSGIDVPYEFGNAGESKTYGVEVVNSWKPTSDWTLQAWYSWIHSEIESVPNSLNSLDAGRVDPHNQAFLRSLITLPGDIDFDTYLRYVDSVPNYNVSSYFDLTLRIGWRYNTDTEFAVVGANLLHDSHREYSADSIAIAPADLQRAVLGTITVKF